MADFSIIAPTIYECKKSPLLVAISFGDDNCYLRAEKLLTEAGCPLHGGVSLERLLASNEKVREHACSTICEAVDWRLDVPIGKEGLSVDLSDAQILAHYYSVKVKYLDEMKQNIIDIVSAQIGKVSYSQACKYMIEHKLPFEVHCDDVKIEPGGFVKYFLDGVLQAKIKYTCSLMPMSRKDKRRKEVEEVHNWLLSTNLLNVNFIDNGNLLLNGVPSPRLQKNRSSTRGSEN